MAEGLGFGILVTLKNAFSPNAKKVSGDMKEMKGEAKSTTDSLKKMQQALDAAASAAIFTVAKQGFDAIVNSASDFQYKMAEVSTLVDTNQVNMSGLNDSVIALSKSFGTPAVDQAAGMYQVLSSGIGGVSESLEVLEASNKLALGGVTTTTTAVDGLTTILNAWKLKSSDSTRVTDTLFTTMKLGKTTIGELGSSIFQVAPTAAALGISLEELGGSLVAMTKQGTKTPIAMTQIKAAISGLTNPSDDLTAIWKKNKFESGEAAIKALGYQGALELLSKETKGSVGQLKTLLGGMEAASAALQITGNNSKMFSDALAQVKQSAGATEEAVAKMAETHKKRADRAKASWEALKITLGNRLLSAMDPLIQKIGKLTDKFVQWLEKHPMIAKAIAYTIAALVALSAVLAIVSAALLVVNIMASPITLTILLIVAAIAAVIAIGYIFRNQLKTLWEYTKVVIDFMKDYWLVFKTDVIPIFKAIGEAVVGWIKDAINWFSNLIAKVSEFLAKIEEAIKKVPVLGKAFDMGKSVFMSPLNAANWMKEKVSFGDLIPGRAAVKSRADQILQEEALKASGGGAGGLGTALQTPAAGGQKGETKVKVENQVKVNTTPVSIFLDKDKIGAVMIQYAQLQGARS